MVDKSAKLKVKGTSKKPKWSSANTNVAKVSGNGKVTAVGRGNTVITAKVGKKKLTCSIEVYVPSLTLDKSSLEMYVGEQCTLNAKIDPPESKVEWKSDNTDVVTVADGVVTAKSRGEAIVSVKNAKYGFTEKCSVNVYDKSLTLSDDFLHEKAILPASRVDVHHASACVFVKTNIGFFFRCKARDIILVRDGCTSERLGQKRCVVANPVEAENRR